MPADSAERRQTVPTRARILNEVQRLITSKGVYGFTLRDVAVPLGVQVPAIYKHYADRDDMLIEVSRRFICALAEQFRLPDEPLRAPRAALRCALDEFVEFHLANPAYVRLSLVDFATPGGGMEYIKLAAGGPFRASIRRGPLAPMYRRVSRLIKAGVRTADFRSVAPLDFYRLVKASLLFHLVFPDDTLLTGRPSTARVTNVKAALWDVAYRYLKPEPSAGASRTRAAPRQGTASPGPGER
jgi:AcrR family transcriptional regulator